MRELEEELKRTDAGRKFLEEAEPEKQTDNLIEFAKEQCEIFPEDSEMGMFLRETLKMLQAEPCEDAISKASVFEIVGNLMSIPYDLDRRITEKDVSESMDEIRVLPPVKPTQNWIPVNERLPKERIAVLVYCPERKNIYCACYEEKQWWIFGAYFEKIEEDVIAWMPLPEPYKGGEEE